MVYTETFLFEKEEDKERLRPLIQDFINENLVVEEILQEEIIE